MFAGLHILILTITFLVAISLIRLCIFLKSRKASRNNTLLILGIQGSGKTPLYHKFLGNSPISTITSARINKDTCTLPNGKNINIVDFPGHRKLRSGLNEYIKKSGCILFLINAKATPTMLTETSQFLYDILTNKYINDEDIPIAILTTRTNDEDGNVKSNVEIKESIEDEIDKVRFTRLSSIHMNNDESDEMFLGIEDKVFEFDHIPLKVRFMGGNFDKNLKEIKQFVSQSL